MNGQSWPTYRRPKWQESRISSLRQQFAAPQVGRLKRKMTGITAGMGYDPQSVQARRASIRGYGEGLGGIMAGAGHLALSQYGQEYGREFEAAKLDFGAELEKARAGWETEERRGREEFQRGEKRFEFDWRTGEREEEQTWRQRYDPSLLERARRRGGGGFAATPIGGRKQGGPVQPFAYSVGEGGRASKPKPELVVYRSGRMELVGKRGPEVRTFPEEGQVISAGKTKKILKNKGFSIVSRKRGGAVKQLEEKMGQSPLRANIMRFLKSTRMDPSGGSAHMPYWQFMLDVQPKKLGGLLGYLRGDERFDLGSGRVSTGPSRKKSTRKGFKSKLTGVTKSPSGPGTAGPATSARLVGFGKQTPAYKRWLGRRG